MKNKILKSAIIIIIILIVAGLGIFSAWKLGYLFKPAPTVLSTINNVYAAEQIKLSNVNQIVKWGTKDGILDFNGQGGTYVDLTKSPVLMKLIDGCENYLLKNGFSKDNYNSNVTTNTTDIRRLKNNDIICNISRTDNPNQTSTMLLACASVKNPVYDITSNFGANCNTDADCGVRFDSQNCKNVCKNVSFKYFNESPKACIINETNFDIQDCKCENNLCVRKLKNMFVTPTPKSTPTPTPKP